MARTKSTPLLDLLGSRWAAEIEGLPDPAWDRPYRRPRIERRVLVEAARLHAEANHSDPFAYGRAMRYMQQGFLEPAEVRTDALAKVAARKGEGVTFPIFTEGS